MTGYNAGVAVEILTAGVPTVAVLIGILINNSRLSDLRAYMESRFQGVDRRFDSMDQLVVQATSIISLNRSRSCWTCSRGSSPNQRLTACPIAPAGILY